MTAETKRRRTVIRRDRVKVMFHQVDMMRVVHNVQYLYWFELGRIAIVDDIFAADPAMKERLLAAVVMNHCEYLEPAHIGDDLIVTTKHTIAPSFSSRFQFVHSISNAKTKAELASGRSEITMVDAATFKPSKKFPQTIWNSYQNLR